VKRLTCGVAFLEITFGPKTDIRNASILRDGRVVFNVGGNRHRIVVWINYPYRVVYIRFIGTHRQYDAQSI
jgi:mRNA interferase HigB